VFPVRYELDLYIKVWGNSVFKGLNVKVFQDLGKLSSLGVNRQNCFLKQMECLRINFNLIMQRFIFTLEPEIHVNV
jgi:hypothetical protein